MSYLIPNALAVATQVAPLDLKLAAFRSFVEEVVRLHDAAYTVVTYADEAVTDATSRRQRIAVMGDPARYVECLYAGDQGTWERRDDVRHVVNVFVYHGVGSASRADAADAFRDVMDSRSAAAPGLLHAIRAQGVVTIQGDETDTDGDAIAEAAAFAGFPVDLGAPEQVRATLAQPEDFRQDFRHEAAFVVTLT